MEESSETPFDFLSWFTLGCVAVHFLNIVQISKQSKVSGTKEVPVPLEGHMTEDRLKDFKTAQSHWDRIGNCETFRETVRMLAIGFTIYYRLDARLWEIAGSFVKDYGYSQENEIIHSLAYLALHFLSLECLEFPIALWNWIVENKNDLIKDPIRSPFLSKQINKATFRSLIRTVKYVGYFFAVQIGGLYGAFYLWAWYLGVTICDKRIVSNWNGEPTPLPDGELREGILNLAQTASFPFTEVYVVSRSTDINVCVRDWSKSIVLLDTFIEKYEHGEIVAVTAHELGRWRSNHKICSFIAYQVYMLLHGGLILLMRRYSGGIFVSLGFKTQPSVIEIVMYCRGLNALRSQGGLLYNLFNRSFVYKADVYAKELGHTAGLRAYLRKEELKDIYARHIYRPYSALHNSVPTLIERLIEIDRSHEAPAEADEVCAHKGCWEFLRGLWNWLRQSTEENREVENPPKKKAKPSKKQRMKEKARRTLE